MDLENLSKLVERLEDEVRQIKLDVEALKKDEAMTVEAAKVTKDLAARIDVMRAQVEAWVEANSARDDKLDARLRDLENRLAGKQGVLLVIFLIARELLGA